MVPEARPDLLQEWVDEKRVLWGGGGLLPIRDGPALRQRVHLGLEGEGRSLWIRSALQVTHFIRLRYIQLCLAIVFLE